MQTNKSTVNKDEQGINLVDLLLYLASKWKWFLLSVLICGGIAWYRYASAPPDILPFGDRDHQGPLEQDLHCGVGPIRQFHQQGECGE